MVGLLSSSVPSRCLLLARYLGDSEPVATGIARGEAEMGFQQVSELIHVPGVTFVGAIPAEFQPRLSFAGAITRTDREPGAASALIRFLVKYWPDLVSRR